MVIFLKNLRQIINRTTNTKRIGTVFNITAKNDTKNSNNYTTTTLVSTEKVFVWTSQGTI